MIDYTHINPDGTRAASHPKSVPKYHGPLDVKYMGYLQARQLKHAGHVKEHGTSAAQAAAAATPYAPIPMYLPTRTDGKVVAKVVTRQAYLDETITDWVLYRTEKIVAIAMGVLAVFALPFNYIVSAILALAAGWFYGQYKWKGFKINYLLKNRFLLEST